MFEKCNDITIPAHTGSCLYFLVDKPITEEEYIKNFLNIIDDIIQKYDEIRIFVYYKDFKGWEESAARLNFFHSPSFIKKIKKVSLVNPPESELTRAIITGGDFINIIKIFKETEFEVALNWIKM